MTREDAFNILAVSETASAEEIRQKFGEMQNDYQVRLTNAPTPNLKKLYQKNITEINEAYKMLGGESSVSHNSDLPSAEPSFSKEEPLTKESFSPPSVSAKTTPANGKTKNTVAEQVKNILPLLCVGLGIIILSLLFLGYIQGGQYNSEIETLKSQINAKDSLMQENIKTVEFYENRFSQGMMKVKNSGNHSFKITWLIVSYLDENGELVKYFKMVNTSIKAGGSAQFDEISGNRTVWDGTMLNIACGIQGYGGEKVVSGLWSQESKDGVLNWNWDN